MDRCDAALTSWSRLQLIYGHLAGEINRTLYRETGLSEADAAVLIALLDTPAAQLHFFELRCGLAWEKSRLSHQLRRMEARRLVERAVCLDDARSSLIRLTPGGTAQARGAREALGGAIRRLLEGALNDEQVEQLAMMTEVIVRHLEHQQPATAHDLLT
jgi:DNA-binding MarR family transcriptional regulator